MEADGWSCTQVGLAASTCTNLCGDGTIDAGEECDDGDVQNSDGCDSSCNVETGFTCTSANPSVCSTVCGDGIVVDASICINGCTTPEVCDDDNLIQSF